MEQAIEARTAGIPPEQIPEMRRSILKRTIKDLVAEKLARLIADGVLVVGDELPSERELSAMLSVSRETIRGAIQALAARGVVQVSHGSRTRVVNGNVGPLRNGITSAGTINGYELEAVHGARLLVERVVVADAAERMTATILRQLDASLTAQAGTLGDPVRFLICDREFHAAIYRAAGNRLLGDFVIDLYTYMMEFRRLAVSQPGAIRQSYEDHCAIVAALRARDTAGVVAAFQRHIDRIYTTTHSILQRHDGPRTESAARSGSDVDGNDVNGAVQPGPPRGGQ